ncbi:hypothetical protein FRC17_008671, partial [Serendipita sp. 399]
PAIVVQDHLRHASLTREYSLQELKIDDVQTLEACRDLTPIPSLRKLAITELFWIDGQTLHKLLSGLPDLQDLTILCYDILGLDAFSETSPPLALLRLSGFFSIVRVLAPFSTSTLRSICVDLESSDEFDRIPEEELAIGLPVTLTRYPQLRDLHVTFRSCNASVVKRFISALPYKDLRLSSFHITLESDYYSSFAPTFNRIVGPLRGKFPQSCAIVLDIPLNSLGTLSANNLGELETVIGTVDDIFED